MVRQFDTSRRIPNNNGVVGGVSCEASLPYYGNHKKYAGSSNATANLANEKKEYFETYVKLYNGVSGSNNSALHHPVKITYETAIRAMDTGVGGHKKDPGLRNDGNWYYSKADETFSAEIEIQYKSGDNWLVDTLTDDGDGITTPAKKGTVTGAHAYFTNETYTPSNGTEAVAFPGYLLNTASGVSASKENFEFEANEYSEGVASTTDNTKTMYKFVGWYLDVDGVESELTYSQNENMAISSKADMRGYTKLIAKYEPYVEKVEGITLAGEYLTLTHDLYANATRYEKSPVVLPDTGTPRITAQILVSGSAVDVPVIQTSTREVKIDTGYLNHYSTGTLKLTLTTTGDANNIYTTTYLKNVADSFTEDHSTSGYVETAVSGTTAYPTGATWTVTEKGNNETTNVGTAVYTTTISGLFDNSTLKANTIHFYSQLRSTVKFNVTYKFYDRAMGSTSQATNISTTPSEFTTLATATVVDEGNVALLGSAITNGVAGWNEKKRVENVIDEYVFWPSQTAAVSGIQEQINYHLGKDDSGVYQHYAATEYHTDHYGNPQSSGEKWVSYKDASGNELEVENGELSAENLAKVASVVVWGFNKPKTYTMTFNTFGTPVAAGSLIEDNATLAAMIPM